MRERNAGIGGAAARRGDAGDDGEGDARVRERLELLTAAAEHERIAALQPHHAPARAGVLDEQLVDPLPGSLPAPPADLPTQIFTASRRARSSTASRTRRSCRITSAS